MSRELSDELSKSDWTHVQSCIQRGNICKLLLTDQKRNSQGIQNQRLETMNAIRLKLSLNAKILRVKPITPRFKLEDMYSRY